ncbi:leucine-rich repeat domain-containing protein [Ancylomarina sp.]|uniref:leucine-rich repeat domain-containing protein n=1 Tax=Ancylomarina sp. TaxID=1970196 RepID=UPI003562582C
MEWNKNISKINLSGQNLNEFPKDIRKLRNLKKIDIRNNNIKHIPKWINELTRLESLDISNNKIETIYSNIGDLKRLKVLILNGNKIKTLPKQIGNLTQLQKLSLANNKLKTLPNQIENLKALKHLNIASNSFDKLPDGVLKLNMVKQLWMSNNPLKYSVVKLVETLPNLEKLYCFSNYSDNDLVADYKILSQTKGNSMEILKSIKNGKHTSNTMIDKTKRKKIFISYSHKDLEWIDGVTESIKSMAFEGYNIEDWCDTKLVAGQDWKDEITKAINESFKVILLVSRPFLASDFIRKYELPLILEKAENEGVQVCPIVVGPCRFKESPISKYQSVNPPEKPLNGMNKNEQDKQYLKLTYDLEDYEN